jgi:hypothetical protein
MYIQILLTMADLKLTTVKVIKRLYDEDFKITTIRGGLNFQRLVTVSYTHLTLPTNVP